MKHDEISLTAEDRPRSDRSTSFNGKNFKRLKNAAANHIDVSQRRLGKQFAVAQSTIHYNLKRVGLKYYKRRKVAKYNKNQLEKVCKVSKNDTSNCKIEHADDEKYLIFSNDEMPQNVGFYTFDKEHASDNVIYKTKEKKRFSLG